MVNICQCCGMPLNLLEQYGTDKDSKPIKEYCNFCFRKGEFTFEGTLEEFIEKQVKIAVCKIGISNEKAREMAKLILPNLKRWQ